MGILARLLGPAIGARIMGFFSGYAMNDVVEWVENLNPLGSDEDGKAQTAVFIAGASTLLLVLILGYMGFKKFKK